MTFEAMQSVTVLDVFTELPTDLDSANELLAKLDTEIVMGHDAGGDEVYYLIAANGG